MTEIKHTYNSRITFCGLYYIAHFNSCVIRVGGTDWGIEIPFDRIGEFVKIFPEIDFEDGKPIEILKGQYVRVAHDGLKFIAIQNIIEPITYFVQERGDQK